MRILVTSYEFPPLGGGGSRVVHGLSRELVRLGHAVDVVTMGFRGLASREDVDGIRVHRVRCRRRDPHVCTALEAASYLAAAGPRVARLVRTNAYDLLHAHFIFPDGLVARLAGAGRRLPVVITAHGSDVPGYNPDRLRAAHALLEPVWRGTAVAATAIACQSRLLRALILRHAPGANVRLIPNGFDVGRFESGRPRVPRILVVTRLLPRKGVQHLIEALRTLAHDWEVVVVGDGPFLPALRRLAEAARVDVQFRGWLANDGPELRDLYETSGIFVLPSDAENFPIVLLEAMTAGLPIVTTRDTGCAEVVGEAGLLVPPRDPEALREALGVLLRNGALRAELGAAARERVEKHFAWEAVARQYLELYRECAERPRAAG